jgi:glycosyltransferase involved in cell wall biosynthesis
MPTYNAEPFVSRAIQSVLAQTFTDFELVVVDDCSSDQTANIVQRWRERDGRIHLIVLDKNSGGPAEPRNVGLQNSSGDLIAFLDQDDMYMPRNLEVKTDNLNRASQALIVSGWSWVVEEKTRKVVSYQPYAPLSWLVRRAAFEENGGFSAEQNGVDDIGWWLRLARSRLKQNFAVSVKEPLTLYFIHAGQSTDLARRMPAIFVKRTKSLLRDTSQEPAFRRPNSIFYSKIGNYYCLGGEMQNGRDNFRESLRLCFNPLSVVLLGTSYMGPWLYRKAEAGLRATQKVLLWRFLMLRAAALYPDHYKEAKSILHQISGYALKAGTAHTSRQKERL